jgi:hypothetical protein
VSDSHAIASGLSLKQIVTSLVFACISALVACFLLAGSLILVEIYLSEPAIEIKELDPAALGIFIYAGLSALIIGGPMAAITAVVLVYPLKSFYCRTVEINRFYFVVGGALVGLLLAFLASIAFPQLPEVTLGVTAVVAGLVAGFVLHKSLTYQQSSL